MNRLDTIESKLVETLQLIDGTSQGAYTYTSTTGQIQLFDEVLNLARNADNKYVNHYIDQQEDIGVRASEFDEGQKAFNQTVVYVIKSKVYNTGDEDNAKNSIRSKMFGVLDDLLYAIGNNFTLSGDVESVNFVSAVPVYANVSNNRIQSGTLETRWNILYSQSLEQPNKKACS